MARVEHIGNATLYLGDCLEILPTLPKVDAVITDPPYSQELHSKHLETVAAGLTEGRGTNGDAMVLDFAHISEETFLELVRNLMDGTRRWVVMTCPWEFIAKAKVVGLPLIRFGVWIKPNSAPQFTGDRPGTGWEPVGIFHNEGQKRWNGGGARGVWTEMVERGLHPTQKPLALLVKWVGQFTDEGETLLDPFMGSGTTGVACMQLGRSFIGIEIEPKYFDIACERIENAQRQVRMFA